MTPRQFTNEESTGGIGCDWSGMRPRVDDPMSWSLPVARIAGFHVRIHALFLLFVLVQLGRALIADGDPDGGGPLGVVWTGVWLVFLLIVVLLHELGHAFVGRRLGGPDGVILMWPLGGLSFPRLVGGWRNNLVHALGGLGVNVVIFLVLGTILFVQTGSLTVVLPPPLLDSELLGPAIVLTARSWLLTALFMAHWANIVVLVFNLLPLQPFDGARILHAACWRSVGYVRAMRIACRIGLVGSILLGIGVILVADGINAAWMIALAFFCGYASYATLRSMEYTEGVLEELDPRERVEFHDDPEGSGVVGRISSADSGSPDQGGDNPRVDRILDKIRKGGISSLSLWERWLLRRATKRRRGER